jgi:hypothetical protein
MIRHLCIMFNVHYFKQLLIIVSKDAENEICVLRFFVTSTKITKGLHIWKSEVQYSTVQYSTV